MTEHDKDVETTEVEPVTDDTQKNLDRAETPADEAKAAADAVKEKPHFEPAPVEVPTPDPGNSLPRRWTSDLDADEMDTVKRRLDLEVNPNKDAE
jgi:hypothetical protein